MLELFSTREIATGIYIVLILIYALWNSQVRKSLFDVIKCALSPKLVLPTLTMCAFGGFIGYRASRFAFWDNVYYKDIIMWIVLVGLPLCFGAISAKEESYFKNAVIDNLKLTVLFELLFSTFTFSLWVELLIIPIVTFVTGVEVIAKREERTKKVSNLMNTVLAVIGLLMLCFTIKHALSEFHLGMTHSMLSSLIIPLILSILYVPFAYLLALYAAYELAFLRMSFREPKTRSIKLKHRIKAIVVCNVSLSKVRLLSNRAARNMYISMPESKFDEFMKNIADKNKQAIL
ncbi:MAG: hypothetical protein IKU38_08135 [Clostridia bacterium]|nr:hypothetical protein [Clostridia bacterium]